MSIEVRVPDEIDEYNERIVAGLSFKQLLFIGIAFTCAVPTFFLVKSISSSSDLATYAAIIVSIPTFCIGFVKINGYDFKTYVKIQIYSILSASKRNYETDTVENELPIENEKFRAEIQTLINKENELKLKEEILEKQNRVNNRGEKLVLFKKRKKQHKSKPKRRLEYEIIEVTAKSIQRKRKAAFKDITSSARINRKKKSK